MIHNGDRIRLSILGAVCPRSGEFFALEASHCDTDIFQVFLDEAAKSITPTRKRNILILDNASWHKRKSLNWHFFEPLYLPPYSPDFNPIERIWLIMKAEHFTNIHCKNKVALIQRADYALCDNERCPVLTNMRAVLSRGYSSIHSVRPHYFPVSV